MPSRPSSVVASSVAVSSDGASTVVVVSWAPEIPGVPRIMPAAPPPISPALSAAATAVFFIGFIELCSSVVRTVAAVHRLDEDQCPGRGFDPGSAGVRIR